VGASWRRVRNGTFGLRSVSVGGEITIGPPLAVTQEFPVRRREFLAFEFKGRAVLVQTHLYYLYFTANYFLIRYYAPWLYSRINS
jgi:hypothetical protein